MAVMRNLQLRVGSISFIAFFATLPFYSPNLMFSVDLPGFLQTMPYFSNALLASVALTAFLLAGRTLLRPSHDSLRFSLVAIATASIALSVTIFVLSLAQPNAFAPLVSVGAGLVCGFGATIVSIAWAGYFSGLDLKRGIFNLGLLCALGALLNTVCAFTSNEFQFASFVVLSIAGTITPLLTAWRVRSTPAQPEQPAAAANFAEASSQASLPETHLTQASTSEPPAPITPAPPLSTLKRMLSVIVGPYIGFLLFALTMALRKIFFFEMLSVESVGIVMGALLVLPLCFIRLEKPLLPFIYQVFIPFVISAIVVLNSFPEDSAPRLAGTLGIYVFFGIIGIIALASFTAVANAREFSVPLIFGFAIGSFALVSALSLRLRDLPLFAGDFEAVLLVLTTLYFIYLMLSSGLRAWRAMFTPSEEPTTRTLQSDLEDRCDELSRLHSLSPRESEIMLYIGRGYSPAYIAKKLFLSDSTVRSHVKNIYRKLNIHSRPELLQLIDKDS